jgi:hypothetical protein
MPAPLVKTKTPGYKRGRRHVFTLGKAGVWRRLWR